MGKIQAVNNNFYYILKYFISDPNIIKLFFGLQDNCSLIQSLIKSQYYTIIDPTNVTVSGSGSNTTVSSRTTVSSSRINYKDVAIIILVGSLILL